MVDVYADRNSLQGKRSNPHVDMAISRRRRQGARDLGYLVHGPGCFDQGGKDPAPLSIVVHLPPLRPIFVLADDGEGGTQIGNAQDLEVGAGAAAQVE